MSSTISAASQVRVISSLASLYILRMLGLFMVLPVLSLAGDEYSGSNTFLLGVALGIYGLTQALLQIPFGLLSDRFGRKMLISIGLILFALGSFVAATSESITGLILGRALQGAGAIAGVIMAMVGDLTTVENRTKAMASIGASIGVAFALALVIGPWVSSYSVMGLSGVKLLFAATVLLSFVGMVILLAVVPDVSSVQQRTSQLSMVQLSRVMADKQCQLLYLGVFVLHYVLMALFIIMPLLLERVGILQVSHAWVYLTVMLSSFVVMVPLMIIGEKKRLVKRIVQLAIGLLAITMLIMAIAYQHVYGLLTCLFLFFVAFNYLEANLPSLLTKTLPADSKGAGSGVFATCQFLGAALGGIVGGALYAHVGVVALLLSAFVLLVIWLVAIRKMRAQVASA
ncbi:MAG: MFS family permease [Candidatus Endobugula sp.]|jgi:MFS family permease